MNHLQQQQAHRVVVIGGGFAGLAVAQALGHASVQVTVLDRRNFHLFQPLLYQVASGSLSPGDIASPIRDILSRYTNNEVLMEAVTDLDPVRQTVRTNSREFPYDTLVLAAGGTHQYFGHDDWAEFAPGLKTLEDALEIRRRIMLAFEAAEKESDAEMRAACMRFVIVGGGPTGVELAGALAELAHKTLRKDYRHFDPAEISIYLVEAGPDILAHYPDDLVQKARTRLEKLGITIFTGAMVEHIEPHRVQIRVAEQEMIVQVETVLWTAGVKASPLGKLLAEKAGAEIDRIGRVLVGPDLTLSQYPNIYVAGDLASVKDENDQPLPGLATVAIQEGEYIGDAIKRQLAGQAVAPFAYRDKGTLAIIGRNAAVADFGAIHLSGFPAWFIWLFVHIYYLNGFDHKLLVTMQWAFSYLTNRRSACLITEPRASRLNPISGGTA